MTGFGRSWMWPIWADCTAAALTVGIAVLVATVLRRASAGDEPRAQA